MEKEANEKVILIIKKGNHCTGAHYYLVSVFDPIQFNPKPNQNVKLQLESLPQN